MNVFFVVNNSKDIDFTLSKEIVEYLRNKKVNIYSDDKELIDKFELLDLNKFELANINFSIIVGGDGTVLKYASKYGECNFPFIGINLGRVGALTMLEPNDYKRYIDKILANDYKVVERLGLSCSVHFKDKKDTVNFIGYNDIILHRSSSLKLLPIEISINGGNKDIFYADGLVVATPNGSSAYNASAGGPLLSHSSHCYVITPICPQSKSFTPLVISDSDVIELSLSKKSDIGDNEVTISSDGCYKYFVSTLDKISIRKSRSVLKMINFSEDNSIYMPVYKAVVSIERKGEK